MTGCSVSTARHSTGKDASLETVRVFILLLWVPFCCVCVARFFFVAVGAGRVVFCFRCARACFLLRLAARRLRASTAERHPGSGARLCFCCGYASSLTHSPPAARSTHSKKAPTTKKTRVVQMHTQPGTLNAYITAFVIAA